MVRGNFRIQNERASTPVKPCGGDSAKQILSKLGMIDFSLMDTVLYLDAYPNCKKAMDYYHKLLAERDSLSKKLAEMGYPINNMSNLGDEWKWTNGPWPWEYEANI